MAHKKPCHECPWKVDSAPGWLGASNPVEFLQTSEAGVHMPCHVHVDYDQDDWEVQVSKAPPCAGRAIHFANRCKSRELPISGYEVDRENVFSNPQDFIDHHSHGKGPTVLIIGKRVIPQD